MNHLQNQWGPIIHGRYHHASRSREEYLLFLSEHPPSVLPINEDNTLANAAYDARLSSSQEEHDSVFVSSGRINPTTHFSTLHWGQHLHDIQDYPLLLHPRDFVNWKHSIYRVALLHRIHPTLDSSYSPTNSTTAPATIAAMQNHMYQVLLHCIRDDTGSSIVINHSGTRDPHLTFADLQQHYIRSPDNVLQARSLLNDIISDTIPSNNRPFHINDYITTFLDNIHTYNSLVDPTHALTSDAKLTNFTNFIHRICDVDTIRQRLLTLSATHPLTLEDQLRFYCHMATQVSHEDSTASLLLTDFAANEAASDPSVPQAQDVSTSTDRLSATSQVAYQGHSSDKPKSLHSIPRLQTGGSIIDLKHSRSITLPVDSDIPNDSNIINLEYDGTFGMVTCLTSP